MPCDAVRCEGVGTVVFALGGCLCSAANFMLVGGMIRELHQRGYRTIELTKRRRSSHINGHHSLEGADPGRPREE